LTWPAAPLPGSLGGIPEIVDKRMQADVIGCCVRHVKQRPEHNIADTGFGTAAEGQTLLITLLIVS
jgi:hypothetical protein